MDIGMKIKTFRIAKNITQETLAQELGVSPQAVSRWENGQTMPDITLLPALSVYFGVRIDDFFELSDEALAEYPDDLYAWSLLGDIRTKQRRYDEAVACYEKSSALNPNPGFTDNYFSVAYICEMQGKWEEAACAYEKTLEVYRTNKKLEDGFGVEPLKQSILRCRAKA